MVCQFSISMLLLLPKSIRLHLEERLLMVWKVEMENAGYGKDEESVREALAVQNQLHDEIVHLSDEIAECVTAKVCNTLFRL